MVGVSETLTNSRRCCCPIKINWPALAIKLLTYATGASPTGADRSKIDAIVESIRGKNYGLRSLVQEVVQSEVFLHK